MEIFQDLLESASMDIYLKFANVAFLIGFLIWFLIDNLRDRRYGSGATENAFYSNNRTVTEHKRWPFVLILWWVCSLVIDLCSVSVYLVIHLSSVQVPSLLPEANGVDFVSLPLLVLLCFNDLPISCRYRKSKNDLKHPLLEKEDENLFHEYAHTFSNGVWSKLTFQWLNPLFKRGRIQKLELPHIPSIPQSETVENASSLLEESIRKRKMKDYSLPKVVTSAILKSLAINAVFAGINTLASYIGPTLITKFMNFLSEKDDYSSSNYGLILASIFFLSKTVESLTQRQWYFGAQRIGIQVRVALTVLIYEKSLSIKFAGPSSGMIINTINMDVERIGDFFLYIHGVWLLPVHVFRALVILYRNLGAGPSLAALFATILVMVSNTPLASMQERFHSKIMDAKDSRIKASSDNFGSYCFDDGLSSCVEVTDHRGGCSFAATSDDCVPLYPLAYFLSN